VKHVFYCGNPCSPVRVFVPFLRVTLAGSSRERCWRGRSEQQLRAVGCWGVSLLLWPEAPAQPCSGAAGFLLIFFSRSSPGATPVPAPVPLEGWKRRGRCWMARPRVGAAFPTGAPGVTFSGGSGGESHRQSVTAVCETRTVPFPRGRRPAPRRRRCRQRSLSERPRLPFAAAAPRRSARLLVLPRTTSSSPCSAGRGRSGSAPLRGGRFTLGQLVQAARYTTARRDFQTRLLTCGTGVWRGAPCRHENNYCSLFPKPQR